MLFDKRALRWFIAASLMLCVSGVAAADSDSDSDSDGDSAAIIGSWETLSITNPSGDPVPGFFTFSAGGTWIATGSSASLSAAHGAWEQTDSNTFIATNKGFIFDSDGSISLLIKNQGILQVSAGGNSFTTVFETQLSLPDGTVIQTINGTGTGTRITAD